MPRRHPIKGRVRRARAVIRGARVTKTGPIKFVKMLVQDAFEQRHTRREYKRTHGKAAYKAARKHNKAADRYYRSKWEY